MGCALAQTSFLREGKLIHAYIVSSLEQMASF